MPVHVAAASPVSAAPFEGKTTMSSGASSSESGRATGKDEAHRKSGAGKGGTALEERVTALIGAGSQFEGKIDVEGAIRIDGEIKGEINSANWVVVGEIAAVEADIRAKTVIINGSVVGNVVAQQVFLKPTGRLQGSVETPRLILDSGAVFNGSSRMPGSATAAQAKDATVQTRDNPKSRTRTVPRGDRVPTGRPSPVAGV